jgi:hypothetical protein
MLYSSPNIIRQIKLRRMRWVGHVTRKEEDRKRTGFLWESPKERNHLEDRGVNGKMGSEWILGSLAWERVKSGSIWLKIGAGGGLM